MDFSQTPFNAVQLELFKLFGQIKSDRELIEIKTIIGRYFANRATAEADRLWDERGYTQQTMDAWMKLPT